MDITNLQHSSWEIRNDAEEIAIMLVAMSIMLISACGKKEKLYEIPDLSQYKTDYVGDSSNVINIVRLMLNFYSLLLLYKLEDGLLLIR